MFKQRVFSLLIVTQLTLLALLLALTLTGCRKVESSENVVVTADVVVKEEKKVELLNEPRWVTADAGLRMRDSAGSSGNKIGLIPNGEQVTLLLEEGEEETIAGSSGRWSKVKWQEQEGWVFGGFLNTEQPVVVEESVDVVESSGKKILIDGKEFDESVLYGLYLIEIETFGYQIVEILPNNIQRTYELISEYHEKLFGDLYYGFPDDYIDHLKKQQEKKSFFREIGTGDWEYDNKSVFSISYFLVYDGISEFKMDITITLENEKLKYSFYKITYESLNYLDKWYYLIRKIY